MRIQISLALLVLLLAGCRSPIGADRVTTRQSYAQVEKNALRTGKPSASTDTTSTAGRPGNRTKRSASFTRRRWSPAIATSCSRWRNREHSKTITTLQERTL
jgi:hypothetical protein